MEGASNSPINSLPNDCLCVVLSLTSPRDACNFSAASTDFRSMLDFEDIWQAFLPSDYTAILSRTVDPVVFNLKKDLFFKLSERHVLIDGGKLSFELERSSGAKCYMMGPKVLHIAFIDEFHSHWRRSSLPDSRFAEVAEPIAQCRIDISCKMNSKELSSNTKYGAYLVYKLIEKSDNVGRPIGQIKQQSSITIGRHVRRRILYLEPFYDSQVRILFNEWKVPYEELGIEDNNGSITAKKRNDGWIEVELGEFYNDNGKYGDVEMRLEEADCGHYWKGGLIVQGIEIRPMH